MAENIISLETAQEWAENYNNNAELFAKYKAITVPGKNLKALLESGAVDVRCYFGINDINEPALMLVGTDENGNDMIDEENNQYIYDMTKPCPTHCNAEPPFINRP